MNCAFCEIPEIKEREVVRNDLARAFLTNIPIVPGHILICPIRCVKTFNDLTKDEIDAIFKIQSGLNKVLKDVFGAHGFNYAWNEGEVAGQSVPHFHLHMLPRKEGDEGITEYEPRKFLYRPGSREESSKQELISISKLIKESYDRI